MSDMIHAYKWIVDKDRILRITTGYNPFSEQLYLSIFICNLEGDLVQNFNTNLPYYNFHYDRWVTYLDNMNNRFFSTTYSVAVEAKEE